MPSRSDGGGSLLISRGQRRVGNSANNRHHSTTAANDGPMRQENSLRKSLLPRPVPASEQRDRTRRARTRRSGAKAVTDVQRGISEPLPIGSGEARRC